MTLKTSRKKGMLSFPDAYEKETTRTVRITIEGKQHEKIDNSGDTAENHIRWKRAHVTVLAVRSSVMNLTAVTGIKCDEGRENAN